MDDFYKRHGLDKEEVERELFKKEVVDEILDKFENKKLTYRGKGGVETVVKNSKQAYAMAMAISEKAWKNKMIASQHQNIESVFKDLTNDKEPK